MRFTIPQFIDIEPKIIGPITPRQFILLIFGGGTIFLCYKIFSFWTFIAITLLLIIPIFGAFTFVKVNGRPFHYFVLNFIQVLKKPNLRIWQKEYLLEKEIVHKKEKITIEPTILRKPLPKSRLSELALQVDTGGRYTEEE